MLRDRKAGDPLPEQQPVTDEETEEKSHPACGSFCCARGWVLLVIALVFAYLFLLLGEPDEEAKWSPEETITMPMGALESRRSQPAKPGQYLWPARDGALRRPALERARVYDTAFGGGYARGDADLCL